jgi:hypothetical protein
VEREWGRRREDIMQRTGLRLGGWKASRKEPRERRRCEWRLVEDTEGKEANEDPAERSLGFGGDGSVHQLEPPRKRAPVCYY